MQIGEFFVQKDGFIFGGQETKRSCSGTADFLCGFIADLIIERIAETVVLNQLNFNLNAVP